MINSRITSKSQTTIPRAVREALGLAVGDDVAYEIDGDRVVLRRVAEPDPFVANFSTFAEWADETDSAYDSLAVLFPRSDKQAQ